MPASTLTALNTHAADADIISVFLPVTVLPSSSSIATAPQPSFCSLFALAAAATFLSAGEMPRPDIRNSSLCTVEGFAVPFL